jgi:hypothetical protein
MSSEFADWTEEDFEEAFWVDPCECGIPGWVTDVCHAHTGYLLGFPIHISYFPAYGYRIYSWDETNMVWYPEWDFRINQDA